jgi:hypothetical protein
MNSRYEKLKLALAHTISSIPWLAGKIVSSVCKGYSAAPLLTLFNARGQRKDGIL